MARSSSSKNESKRFTVVIDEEYCLANWARCVGKPAEELRHRNDPLGGLGTEINDHSVVRG